jgi:hypothetical protein
MQEANIVQLADILEIMGDTEESNLMVVRSHLLGGHSKWFIEDGMAILFEPLRNDKWNVHIYGTGGKRQRDFAVRAGRYMVDNHGAKIFLNFVSRDRMDLRFFMRMIGSKKVGLIGDEILYISTEHMGIKEN